MKLHLNRFMAGALLYVTICVFANLVLTPFSLVNFIGPAAGLAGVLAILWGRSGLFSALIGLVSFHIISIYYFDQSLDISIILISSLAIFLQAYWVKQLTVKSIKNQKWLNNRLSLLKFIFYIGPLAGLVSASASLLIAVLDVQQINSLPFYVVVIGYAGSILFSVFAIPVFLFSHGRQKLTLTKRLFLIVSSLFGMVAVGFLFYVSQQQHELQREQKFKESYDAIHSAIQDEISGIQSQLNGVSALFQSSNFVSLREFRAFSHYIYNEASSISLIQWTPAVEYSNKLNFEKKLTEQLNVDYQITERTLLGDIVIAPQREVYLPVNYIYPANQYEEMYGMNLWHHEVNKVAISHAIISRKSVATEPFTLNFDRKRDHVFFIFKPIYNGQSDFGVMKLPQQSPASSFLVVLVKIAPFLKRINEEFPEVELQVEDISQANRLFVYGDVLNVKSRQLERFNLNVFTRNWQFSVIEKNAWSTQQKPWQMWAMVIGATIGGVFFQILFLMMAVYSIELNYRVTAKTRELILAKDQADKENHAKTQFLYTLSNELRTPFNVIKHLTETFPSEDTSPQIQTYFANISDASLNLEQLIDTVNELTNIETGFITLNHRPFDFSIFISRMENMIKVSPHLLENKVRVITAKDIPSFIDTDELRLQKLFMMLVENVGKVLSSKNFCISVNIHFHKLNNATLFFVVTNELEDVLNNSSILKANALTEDADLSSLNTRMAMLKELCVLFGGDLKLSQLPSGNLMVSASVKVNLYQLSQDNVGRNFMLSHNEKVAGSEVNSVLLVQELHLHDENLCQNLLNADYQVEIIEETEDIFTYLDLNTYQFVIFDCANFTENMIKVLRKARNLPEYKNIPLIGLVPTSIEQDQIIILQNYISEYVFKPVSAQRLSLLLTKYKA